MYTILETFRSLGEQDESASNAEAVASAIYRRLDIVYPEVFKQYEPELIEYVVADVARSYQDLEELGSSDVSVIVTQVISELESYNE